jgi:HSP20 family protein
VLHTDPFALLSDLERQFDRAHQSAASRNGWLPAADVIAGEHEVRVIMDAPGVRHDDLSIEIHDGTLTVSGERRPVDVTGSSAQRIERGWGRWSRSMRLRDGLDADGITANLADGVLTVTIPVAEQAKPRRIEIGTADPAALTSAT